MTLLNVSELKSVSTVQSSSRQGFSQWIRSLVAGLSARIELGRIVRSHQSRGSPIPPYLRKDLGLPEFEQEPWRAFDNW